MLSVWRYYFLFLLFSISSLCANKEKQNFLLRPHYEHYLSICSVFQNEAPYLKEWIEYHRIQGVEYFYLYNNESSDNYLEILEPYIKQNVVEITDWPNNNKGSYTYPQMEANNHCIERCKDRTMWLALIDIDEFIVPKNKDDLVQFLSEYDGLPNVGAININWQTYGTSNLPCIPADKLLIESLVFKAPVAYNMNEHFKTIVKPIAIEIFRVHGVKKFREGFYGLPADNLAACRKAIDVKDICVNHYWTRAKDFLYTAKLERLYRIRKSENKNTNKVLKNLNEKDLRLNVEHDSRIQKWLPELRKRIFGLA